MKSSRTKLWRCPRCRRKFTKRNQAHSCLVHTVAQHFRGKDPRLRRIYELLISRLRRVGGLRIDAVKSSINLVSKYHFGGVSVRKNSLRVGFLSDERIEDERILAALRVGPAKVAHWVRLLSSRDIDAQLLHWLKKAYLLQSG